MKEIFERRFDDIKSFNRFQSVLLKPIEVITFNIRVKALMENGWLYGIGRFKVSLYH